MASASGARKASMWGADQLQQGEAKTLAELGKGFDFAQGQYGKAGTYYAPFADRYGAASGTYADAMGLNGPEGNTRASAAFQSGPGYDFTMSQGLEALNRRRAAGGMLNSGNADTDAITFATGLADKTYGDWLGRLSELDARGLTTAGARAGLDTTLGSLGYGYYGDRASTMDDTTKNIVGLGTAAFKAGDEAKAANQNMLFGGLQLGAGLLGGIAGLGTGGGATLGGSLLGKLFK